MEIFKNLPEMIANPFEIITSFPEMIKNIPEENYNRKIYSGINYKHKLNYNRHPKVFTNLPEMFTILPERL